MSSGSLYGVSPVQIPYKCWVLSNLVQVQYLGHMVLQELLGLSVKPVGQGLGVGHAQGVDV